MLTAWTEIPLGKNVGVVNYCTNILIQIAQAFPFSDADGWEFTSIGELHISVNYLGEISHSQLLTVRNLYNSRYWDGIVRLAGLSYFPNEDNPEQAILHARVSSDSLVYYQAEIDKLFLQSRAYGTGHTKFEYTPHITLAYCPLDIVKQVIDAVHIVPVEVRDLTVVVRTKYN